MNKGIIQQIEAIVLITEKGCNPQIILNMLLAR